jgi:hypothetical protein
VQQRLYTAYARGYVGTVNDELVDAVITTVLHIAPLRAVDLVAILAPPDIRTLVMDRVRAAKVRAAGRPFATSIDETIERMRMGIPPVWWPREPRVWVAVGVPVDDATPAWLRRRLIETEAQK